MNILRKSLSLIITISILMSVCAICFGTFASATTTGTLADAGITTNVYNFVNDSDGTSSYTVDQKWEGSEILSKYTAAADGAGLQTKIVANEGLYLATNMSNYLTTGNYRYKKNSETGKYDEFNSSYGWYHHRAFLRDSDVNNNEVLKIESGKTYAVVVKFKNGSPETTGTFGLGIGVSLPENHSAATIQLLQPNSYKNSIDIATEGDKWHYVAAVIDGDGQVPIQRNINNVEGSMGYAAASGGYYWNVTDKKYDTDNYRDRHIVINPRRSTAGDVLVESVTVYVKDNDNKNQIVLAQQADGSYTASAAVKGSSVYGDKSLGSMNFEDNAVIGWETDAISTIEEDCILLANDASASEETIVYDFIDSSTGLSSYKEGGHHISFSNSEGKGSKINTSGDEQGMVLKDLSGGDANMYGYTKDGFGHYKALIKDNDNTQFNKNGWFQIETGKSYDIKVYFTGHSSLTAGYKYGIGIGYASSTNGNNWMNTGESNPENVSVSVPGIIIPGSESLNHTAGDGIIHVASTTINASDMVGTKFTKAITTKAELQDKTLWSKACTYANMMVCIIPHVLTSTNASANGCVLIKKVVVTVRNEENALKNVYDFVYEDANGDLQSSYTGLNPNQLFSFDNGTGTAKSYIDTTEGATGMNFYAGAGAKDVESTGTWRTYRAYIRDNDVNSNKFLQIEAGKTYGIVVKYKAGTGFAAAKANEVPYYELSIDLSRTNSVDLNVYGNQASNSRDIAPLLTPGSYSDKISVDTAGDSWQYLTAVIDGDGASNFTYSNGAWTTLNNAGRFVALRWGGSAAGSIFIESVTVYIREKTAIDTSLKITDSTESIVLTQQPDGSYKGDIWANDTVLPEMTNEYNETSNSYSAVVAGANTHITAVTADSIIAATPKFASTMDMNDADDVYDPNNIFKIVNSGEDGHGAVLEATIKDSFSIRGLQLETNKTYYISMQIKFNKENALYNNTEEYCVNYLTASASTEAAIGVYVRDAKKTLTNRYNYPSLMNQFDPTKLTEWQNIGYVIRIESEDDAANFPYLVFGIDSTGGHYSYRAWIDNVVITAVDDVAETYTAANSVDAAVSIRKDQGLDAQTKQHVSAGLRVKGTLNTATIADAKDVGFVVLPTAMANANADWYMRENWASAQVKAVSCKDTVYSTEGTKTSYQLVITGLSEYRNEAYRTAYKANFTVKMYVVDSEGNYTYYNVGTTSYNTVRQAYRVYDIANWENY